MADLADRLSTALAGRYVIQRELGAGGMATVFLAQDLRHRRSVAIKVLHPELAAVLGTERFLREIETAAGLTHPHILPLHDSGSASDLLYYVMPYAEGESLRQRLEREKQLPLADALRIARETADALDYAHRRGVVHRDIKPENILLAEQHAVVADFGIARAIVAAGAEQLTATGTVIGTPVYMSPEQCVGGRDLDGRSDQYSLGCVLYEMLSGQPPFTGPSAESLAHQHLSVPPRPVTVLRTSVPEAIGRAIHRTLAKTAADRFGTAAEFAAAIAPSAEPVVTGPRPGSGEETARAPGPVGEGVGAKPAMRRPRQWVLAGIGIIVALVAVAAWQRWGPFSEWLGGSGTPHATKKDWILVAEFDGPPDDSSLAATTRDLVSAALDQSEIVATVPAEEIRSALQTAGKPAGTRVDAALAKELASRSAVRTVLEGKIGRLGQGYSLVLRVVDAESLKVVVTERAVAKNQDALIPEIGRLVEKLRAGLGEKRSAIQTNRSPDLVATPSYEAYRLYVQGMRLNRSRRFQEAIAVFRDAVALDPDFAMGWRRLGLAFGNANELDSALAAFDQALRRPQRLTAAQRLDTEGVRAMTEGDLGAALAANDRILQDDPTSMSALQGRGVILHGLGRLEESLESHQMSARASPFGISQLQRSNELISLLELGRVDEARAGARYISGVRQNARMRMIIERLANNWAAVERMADTLLADPGLAEDDRAAALYALGYAQAARGAFKAAAAKFEHEPPAFPQQARRTRLMLTMISQGAIPLPPDTWARDSSTANLITRGLRAALAGEPASARRFLNAARSRSRREQAWQGAAPALLEAWIEAGAGRWDEVARILRPIAAQRVEIGWKIPGAIGISTIRWCLADAFERLGQPDSASVVLEQLTSDPGANQPGYRGILIAFAHRRLVLLYARMGRLEDAKQHWRVFTETVRTPDPEIQPLIEEARAALASAEGMAKSARR